MYAICLVVRLITLKFPALGVAEIGIAGECSVVIRVSIGMGMGMYGSDY